jgi:HEAT repeat protein
MKMQRMSRLVCGLILLGATGTAIAQAMDKDQEELQMAAMEALIAAPDDRALPLASKVLNGNYSEELKERALFVLSQIDHQEAQEALLTAARAGSGELRYEAVRMIGIGGNDASLAALRSVYADGDPELRDAVLEAYLIADDADSVYELAVNAQTEDEFGKALEILGAMDAREQLRQLRDRAGSNEDWIDALAVSGDLETLRDIASDNGDPARQARAIEALGIAGGDEVNGTLVEIYRNADSGDVREAALNGMLIADYDAGVLELYRESKDPIEKKALLQYLVNMDSDLVWDVIDSALGGTE